MNPKTHTAPHRQRKAEDFSGRVQRLEAPMVGHPMRVSETTSEPARISAQFAAISIEPSHLRYNGVGHVRWGMQVICLQKWGDNLRMPVF